MGKPNDNNEVVVTDTAAGGNGGGVSLGKGAWDCDNDVEIPPEAEGELPEIYNFGDSEQKSAFLLDHMQRIYTEVESILL